MHYQEGSSQFHELIHPFVCPVIPSTGKNALLRFFAEMINAMASIRPGGLAGHRLAG